MAYKKGSVFEAVYKEKMTGDSSGVDALIQQHQQEARKKRAENAQTVSTSGGVPPYDRTEAGIAADRKNDILRTAYEGQGRKTLFPSVPAKKETKPSYSEAQSKLDKAKKIAQQIETWNGSKFGVDAMDKVYDDQIKDLLSKNGYQSYDDLQNAIDSLGKDAYRLKNEERYGNLDKNADFAEKSQAVPGKKTSGIGIALGTSWIGAGDAKFDYINDIDGYRKKFAGVDKQGNSPYAIYDYMEPGEVAKYNYIHNTQGEKAANEYLDYLKYDLDARKTQDVAAGYGQYATEHPVAASAASVPANLMGGIGYLSAAGQYVGNKFREGLTGEYRPVNYNTWAMYPTIAATTIRGTVSENIADSTGRIQLDEWKHPILSRILNGKSLGDVYQMGMSMADSAAVALLTPVIGNGGLALLGGSAATQGMMDALDRGATDGQAITMGMLNGAFETIFEKVSLENLLQNYSKTTIQAIFSQMLAEGSEEFNTTLANDAADLLVMAEKSDYRQNIEKYRQQGLDEETATKYALWDKAVSLAWDAIGGAVSGGIMGAVSAPIERRFQNVQSGGNAQVQQEAPAAAPEQQTQMAVPDQQMPLKTPEQQTNEAIQKALNMNKAEESAAPQGNALDEALAKFSETGKVSNKTAEKVLGDPEAVRQLIEKTGAELGYTASQKRNAVKQAIADIFSGTNKTEQNATEQAPTQETAYRDEAVPQAAEKPMGENQVDNQNAQMYNENKNIQGGTNHAGAAGQTGAQLQSIDGTGLPGRDESGRVRGAGAERLPVYGQTSGGLGEGTQMVSRGIQEESGGGNSSNELRVSGILRVSSELQNAQRSRGTPTYAVQDTTGSPEGYEKALADGRNSDPQNGWCVTPKSAQELRDGNVRTFMNENGTVGVGVAPDGDIVAVFKNKNGGPRKALDTMMPIAIEQGGDRLDCYGEGLARLYAKYGFEPVARVEFNPEYANEGWTPDKGTPYIYVMKHNGDSADAVAQKMGTYPKYTKEQLDALPTYGKDDYDSAMAYRDSLMGQKSTQQTDTSKMSANGGQVSTGTGGTIGKQNAPSGDAGKMEHGSVGAANQNFTGTAAYDDLLTDENVQPPRSSDAKNVEVPKVDAYGRNVSEFAQNAMNSDIISERDVDTAKRLISEGVFGHEVQRMDDVRERVYKEIQNKGLSDSVREVSRAAASGKLSEYDIAKAEVLFAMLTNKKGTRAENMASDLLVDLSEMATQSGRQLNMFKLLRRLTPVGQLSAVKTNMKRYVDNLNKSRSGKKKVSVEIPEELEKAYIDAATSGDEGKQREALDQIYKCAASQFPSTLEEKFNALRHMAMLGNPMTHIRNFGATGAFRPMASIKRTISAAIQSVTLDQKNRTAAVIGVGKEGRALLNWATADAKSDTARSMMKGTYQNGDNARNTIEDYRTIFKTKWLEGTRQVIGNALEAEDMVWKKREYALTLASFLKARGYTAQQAQSGVIPESVMTEGRQLAVQEALKSTFNDRNRFSDLMSKFRKKGNTATDKALNIMAEGILPYTRTPANIAVRGVEYSPAGLAKSFADLATGIKSGKITAAQGIDNLAAGLTGTGIMILGAGLAAGLVPGVRLVGELPEDDEPEENTQENAIEIGGKSFGIGWVGAPAIPLLIGANLYNRMKSVGKDGDVDAWDVISSIVGAMKSGLDPILELSCMSGINDAIDDMKYEETGGDKAVSFVYHAATGYFLQAIPTVFGQIEKAVEPNKKKTFTNGETDVQRIVERTIGSTFRKLPGDPYQIDKVDAYGNVVKESDNPLVRVANAFVNPFTVQDIDRSAVTKEIKRLNGVQPDSVNIPSVPKTISYTDTDGNTHDDQRLTAEQYSTLEKVQKQTASKILNEVIGTDIYKAMTDEQKADVFGYVYDYAREKGRSEAIKGYPGITDAWMKDVEKNGYGAIAGKVISKGFADAFESMEADDLDSAYKLYKSLSFINREKFKRENGGRTGYLITAKENGVSTKAFTSLYSAYKSLDNNTSMEIKEKAQEWSVALEKAYDSGQITKAGRDALKDEMKFYYQTPANTAKFDAMTESGVSTYDADRIIKGLNALTGTGSVNKDTGEKTVTDADKWEYISEVDGISDSERDMLMKLYMPDYDQTAKNPVKTELKYDYLRDQGYSAEEYVETYRVTQQYSKKAERINAWKALGYSDAEARMFYKLYKGKIDLTG